MSQPAVLIGQRWPIATELVDLFGDNPVGPVAVLPATPGEQFEELPRVLIVDERG